MKHLLILLLLGIGFALNPLSALAPSSLGALSTASFVPKGLVAHDRRPLVVALHGCRQNAADFAAGTELNRLAAEKRFFVLYPEQDVTGHPLNCWNWFSPIHQNRTVGNEPTEILAAIQRFTEQHPQIDDSRVYVVGLSAGAAMTNILASCYPERFAGAAMVAGLPYAAASNAHQALRLMNGDLTFDVERSARLAQACALNSRKQVPILILQGLDDQRVKPVNAESIAKQWQTIHDLKDDDQLNDSVNWQTTSRCTDGRCTRDHTVSNQLWIRTITVEGIGHVWPGSRGLLPYTDKNGPDATQVAWDFFLQVPSSR